MFMSKRKSPQIPWPAHIVGANKDRPLILLHGFMGNGRDWDRIAIDLAARGWHCIAFDLPGHSPEHGLEEPVGMEAWSDGLVRSLEAMGLAQVPVVGYSMGGRLALYTAWRHPERIKALVLEGTNAGMEAPQQRATRAALDDQRAEDIRRNGLPPFLERWYQMDLFVTLQSHPAVRAQMLARRAAQDPETMATILSEMSPGRQPYMGARLKALQVPCTLLAGALDPRYAPMVVKMAAQIPGATHHLIPQAGHNTHLEAPEAFCQRVHEALHKL